MSGSDPRDPGAATPRDLALLRESFALAETALEQGERPFGAVIAGPAGAVLARAHNCGHARADPIAHAEVTAIRALPAGLSRADLAAATLYSSAEPCAMCAGAIYWAGIGRIVYGLSETRLRTLRNVSPLTAALAISCRAVLVHGGRPTDIVGPLLEDEAEAPHRVFWHRAAGLA